MKITAKRQFGFTLIELLITIAIIGILSAIAMPIFQNYYRRAYYAEVVSATHPYVIAIGECFQITSDLTACNAGSNNIPVGISAPGVGAVNNLTVVNGVITVTPNVANGIVTTDNYILTPQDAGGRLVWQSSGGGVTNRYTTQETF